MSTQRFIQEVVAELGRARAKFPSPDGLMCALTEETGEVAKALLDEPWENVRAECVQVAAMALRVALEGDPTLFGVRLARGNTDGPSGETLIPAFRPGAMMRWENEFIRTEPEPAKITFDEEPKS